MYFSIIPFSHSIGTQPLLYFGGEISEDSIGIGSLVEIPYGNTIENGIIVEKYSDIPLSRESESYSRIKTIIRIITPKIILATYQLDMICSISMRYLIPIHRVLAIFLSRPILSRLERKNYEQLTIENPPNFTQQISRIQIAQNSIITPVHTKAYINGHTVFILPDDFSMIPYQQYYSNRDDVLFVRNDMTDTRKAQAWIDIYNGKFSIIFGTRKILYYNLLRYSNIIYIEDSLGSDYWHYPIRIHYIDIIRIFVQSNPLIGFTLLTSVPTLSMLTYFRNFEIKNIK